ncbi:MAG: type III pantothenate kinase [Sphingobacteriaceae bacterium]|jgi:type III pantothenate kinase
MANLVIDIGNTHTKVAVFNEYKLVSVDHYESLTPQDLLTYLNNKNDITYSILSSVSSSSLADLEEILSEQTIYIRFSTNLATSINNQYKSPQTLGLDRLAGMVGAQTLYPGKNCLVIDAGTCITYDVVNHEGIYNGGSISLGIHMRLKALHVFTDKLPLIDFDDSFMFMEGSDTRASILSGVIQGAVLEMQGFITNHISHDASLQVILCGGDAAFFDTRLKNTIFADTLRTEPNLVLIGLNDIIRQQND